MRSAIVGVIAVIALWLFVSAPGEPALPPVATWHANQLVAGSPAQITVQITAGTEGLPAGTELRIGFPHWVYGSVGVR